MADVEHGPTAASKTLRSDFSCEADNWYGVVDPKQRKRIQDRLAQRARRKRLAESQGSLESTKSNADATSAPKRKRNQSSVVRKRDAAIAAAAAERALLLRAEKSKTVRDLIKDIRGARKSFITVARYFLPLGIEAATVERLASEYALEQLGLKYQNDCNDGECHDDHQNKQRDGKTNGGGKDTDLDDGHRNDSSDGRTQGNKDDDNDDDDEDIDDASLINNEIEDPTGMNLADPFERILEQVRDGTALLPPLDAPSSFIWSTAGRSPMGSENGGAGTASASSPSITPWPAAPTQSEPLASNPEDVTDTAVLIPSGVTDRIASMVAPFSSETGSEPIATEHDDPLIPTGDSDLTSTYSTALTTLSGAIPPSAFLPPTSATSTSFPSLFQTYTTCANTSSCSTASTHRPFPSPAADPFFMSIPLVAVYAALWHNGSVLSLTCVPTEVRHLSDRRHRLAGSGVPRDLRPTRLQTTVSHMTWIDRFPSARFRDNMIRLTESGAVDANLFMYDIFMMPSFYIVPGGVSWVAGDWRLSDAFAAKWGFAFC